MKLAIILQMSDFWRNFFWKKIASRDETRDLSVMSSLTWLLHQNDLPEFMAKKNASLRADMYCSWFQSGGNFKSSNFQLSFKNFYDSFENVSIWAWLVKYTMVEHKHSISVLRLVWGPNFFRTKPAPKFGLST